MALSTPTRAAVSLFAPIRALLQGAMYATKVRVPHAAVMLALFGNEKNPVAIARKVAALAFEHAKHLAYFAAVYKAVLVAGRILYTVAGLKALPGAPGQPAAMWHALIAGALGARLVWSPYSNLNFQIVLYLLSRVLVAACKSLARRGVQPFANVTFPRAYPVLAVATWAAVMYLFEADPASLHPSLASSMREIYAPPINSPEGSRSSVFAGIPFPTPSMAFVLCFLLWDVGPASFLQLFRLPGSAVAEGSSQATARASAAAAATASAVSSAAGSSAVMRSSH
jgi:peroxisomal membrane protein 4